MAGPYELIQQGRGWLLEGEGPEAVAEEAQELIAAAGDGGARAAWLLVLAEARLAACKVSDAAEAAAEAVALFKHAGERVCEAAAVLVLVDVLLVRQEWEDAVAAAVRAVDLFRGLRDAKGEAEALLKLARARLHQMKDPYAASRAAMAASEMSVGRGDKRGSAEALLVAAQAQLLYDPERALQVAKDAAASFEEVGDYRAKAEASQLVAAAKAQIATVQHAEHAGAVAARGDGHVPHKWPRYEQQRGEAPLDPFAYGDEQLAMAPPAPPELEKKVQTKNMFMRKSFKWTEGRHATDAAWFRQELRYLAPPEGDR